MIELHPRPRAHHDCPYCLTSLAVDGWYMPGMRALAELHCESCGRAFYGDLTAAQALYTPLLMERENGLVHDRFGVPWFADWLAGSYRDRVDAEIPFAVETLRPPRNPLILNCLDKLYGHALLKFLNVQFYLDHRPDVDPIVLVPRYLRWMVPDGVAEIWTVDLPLRRGTEWNDWLARAIAARVASFERCMLGIALPHPHPGDYDIERFTRVAPLPEELWSGGAIEPRVAFIWREDRLWGDEPTLVRTAVKRVARKAGVATNDLARQRERVIALADALRAEIPRLAFAVVGMGAPGDLPAWIDDRRATAVDEPREREWCALYAASHLAIGIHGSNMLLPSAHAGAVLELVPRDRWGNYLQDLLIRHADPREAMIHCRLIPEHAPVDEVAAVAVSMLRDRNAAMLNLSRRLSRHADAAGTDFVELRLGLGRSARDGGEESR